MNGEGGRLGNVFARVCVCVCMCILHFNQDFNQMKEEGHRKHEKCAIKVRFTTKATANDERKIKQRFRRNDPFDLACVSHFAEMHAAHSHIDAMRERYYDEQ